jgi:hypothetical protein
MKYEIRYYRDSDNDYVVLATCDTIEQARDLRVVSGDLVVEAATNTVVADPSWLWDWEKTDPGSYARHQLGRRRPGRVVAPHVEMFGYGGIGLSAPGSLRS